MLFKAFFLLLLVQLSFQYGSIDFSLPTKVSVVNYGFSSIYTFTLKFQTPLLANNYLMINFTNYTEALVPNSCFYSTYPIFPEILTTCSVPNSDNILFVLIPIAISSQNIYTFVIELKNTNPIPLSSLGSSLELKTVSSPDISTFFIYDYNPNFDSIPYNTSCQNVLSASLFSFNNSLTYNVPSSQVNINLQVKINVEITGSPKIKLVLAYPWTFLSTTILQVSNDPKYIALSDSDATKSNFKAPTLSSFQIESPLEASLIFSESLEKGQSFLINIINFVNPSTFSTIYLKIYTMMSFNSASAIEASENSIQLQTLQNSLVVSLGLASRIPLLPDSPGSFYKNTRQYLEINVTSSQRTPDNSYLKLTIGATNQIIQGSASIFGLSEYNSSLPMTLTYSSNTLLISNIKSLAAISLVTVTLRVLTSSVDSMIFASASYDLSSTSTTANFYGMSKIYYFQSNGYPIISSLILSISPTNTLVFTITPSSDDTSLNSYLEIYFSRFISFTSNPTCDINIPAAGLTTSLTCTLTNAVNYNYIKLTSASGTNRFPSSGATITIGGFSLTDCSNHQDKVYEFYFGLYYNTLTSPKLFLMVTALALPTRNTLSNFYQSISNDLYWTTFNYNYPSIINLVGTASAFNAITSSTNSKIVITIFAYRSFQALFGSSLITNSSYPCGSNIQITCTYIQGDSQSSVSSSYFLDWDRVHIFLPNTISQDFHIVLPDIFQNLAYTYEIYVGTVNGNNQFSYKYLESQLLLTPSIVFSTSNLNANIQIQNSGFAAAKINNFKLNIYSSTSHLGNLSPDFGAALVIVTNWELWVSGSSSVASGSAFGTLQNSAVNFDFLGGDGTQYFVLYLPLINPSNLNTGLLSYLDGVYNPFSLDLPNYVIYVTTRTGGFDSYNAFFNAGTNSYTSNALKQLDFSCKDLRESEKNTFCTLTFQTNNRLESNGNIRIQATGLTFHPTDCSFTYANASAVYSVAGYQCVIQSSAGTILNIALNSNSAIDITYVAYFNISFYGADIETNGAGSVIIALDVMDFSSNYIMETLTKSFSVSPKIFRFITISSISLEYYNPNSVTQMNVTVNFPRNVYPNENVCLDLGSDLFERNQNPEEIQTQFFQDSTKLAYLISVKTSGSMILLALKNSFDSILAGSYYFTIKGVKLPNRNLQSSLAVFFLRSQDQSLTLQSYSNSSTSFPQLVGNQKPNIQILEAKYTLEGHVSEFVFGVTILSSSLDYNTIIYLNFPEYYSPSLYRDSSLLYCGLGNLSVTCSNDDTFPYRLKLTNFPTFLYAGSSFNITIYGILTPKYSNRNLGQYLNSSIVFGVDQFKNGSFSEIANLLPPSVTPLSNPFNFLSLSNLVAESLESNSLSNHHFELVLLNLDIPGNSGFLINFGAEYTYLSNLESIQCKVTSLSSNGSIIYFSTLSSCEVRGKRVKGYFNSTIPASTKFNVSLINVPSPSANVTIDPNLILISIFNSTDSSIISFTSYLMNSASTITFSIPELDITVNNGNSIILTQGSYSPLIPIGPNQAGVRFQNNLILNVSLDGFVFNPSSLQISLGDFTSEFVIGSERDLLNGIYSFSFTKKEFGFKDVYQTLNEVYLFLTSNPIKIVVPDQLIVSYSGCNLPYILELANPPFKDLALNFMVDYDNLQDSFFIDEDLNSYSSVFLPNNTVSVLSFCTDSSFDQNIASTIVYLTLSGLNSDSYYLSNSQINIIFQNKTRIYPPVINSTINRIGRTEASISLQSNCDGLAFYRIVNRKFNQKNLTSVEILERMQTNNFTSILNNSNNYEIGIYEIIEFEILYNTTVDLTVNNTVTISGLTPSTEYEFFAYSRNDFTDLSMNFTYLRFTTQVLLNLTKILAIYDRSIYEDESNNFYCFLVRNFQTKAKLIVASDGTSCSFGFSPTSYYYQYSGQTFSAATNRTNLYIIPDADLEDDSTHDLIELEYNQTTKIFNSDFIALGLLYSIDYVDSLIFIEYFNQTLLYNAQDPFVFPELVNISLGVVTTKYNSTILVQNLTLSGDGAVYFIMDPYLKTYEDSEFPGEYYNQTIRTYEKPTADQIKNCKNYLNQTAAVCFRAIYYNQTTYQMEIRNLDAFTVYKVYFVIANENPIFPVLNNTHIYEMEALSYSISGLRLTIWVGGILMMTLCLFWVSF